MSAHPSSVCFRLRLLRALQAPGATVTAVCRAFGLSRPTFYKWRRRFQNGGPAALHDRSHAPRRHPQRRRSSWRTALLALRRRHPRWGAKKLRHLLQRQHPRSQCLPALRTLERWLQQAQLTLPPAPRARSGPKLPRPALTKATAANHVWTIDFKGWFLLANGQRCAPLTVRDLATRFLLDVRITTATTDRGVRAALRPIFQRFGLPAVLRMDNGTPFGSLGPLGLSTLSVWWRRLGIRVEFIRPGKPQDNGGHEQMHRILKAETTHPPAPHPRAQQRRLDRWRHQFNALRPHEALGGLCPAMLYRPSSRPWQPPKPLRYPTHWLTRKVLHKGVIKFQGRARAIGRAFAGQIIGLRPLDPHRHEVFLDDILLGILHHNDPGAIRPCRFTSPHQKSPRSPTKCKPSRGGDL